MITEIINLKAILSLPKGTEHYLSDLHGEYEAFIHILNSGSGIIKSKINELFKGIMRQNEQNSFATLIYYPKEKLREVIKTEENIDEWYKITLHRLTKVCGTVSSKYTRSKVRKNLPELAARLSLLPGIEDLSLSSNATRMQKQAAPLKKAGISRINISLDTLRADRFKEITGGGKLEKVINGLLAAKEAGFHPVKS